MSTPRFSRPKSRAFSPRRFAGSAAFLAALFAAVPVSALAPPPTTMPVLVEFPTPVYPPDAKAAGVEGTVQLSFVVSKEGSATCIRAKGDDRLCPAAIEAASRAKFEPALRAGEPCETRVCLPVRFELDHANSEDAGDERGAG